MRGKSLQKPGSVNSMRNLSNPNEETKSSISSYKGRRYKLTRGSSVHSVEREQTLPNMKYTGQIQPERPQSNPNPDINEPQENITQKQVIHEEKTVEQINKEEFKNNASYDLLNELLSRSNNFDKHGQDVSMNDTSELKNVRISGEDNFRSPKELEQSQVQDDLIKKLLGTYVPEFESKIKKNGQGSKENIDKNDDLVQVEPKIVAEKELNLSPENSIKTDELSDTSDDDFLPNKIIRQNSKKMDAEIKSNR